MMNKNLIIALCVLGFVIFGGISYFNFMTEEKFPGETSYRMANKFLEDGKLDEALSTFDDSLSQKPDHAPTHLGKAITLMQLRRFNESRTGFDRAIELDPKFALAYANRGILNDRTGRYEEALGDYRKALEIDPELTEGPGWFWRFLHNVPEKPPTIADRAAYIENELSKPEGERLLRVPELDSQQQMYNK